MKLSLQIRTLPRAADGDEERLVSLMHEALEKGGAPPVAVVLRPSRVEILGLRPVAEAGLPLPSFLAGLTRSQAEGAGAAEAVGLLGRFSLRRRGASEPGVPVALAFLEWGDCRWWQYRALLEPETGQVRDDTETRASAVEGDPLPAGLGRWWSLGRRTGARVRIDRQRPPEQPLQTSDLVH